MIYLCILAYLAIAGIITMDRGHELDYALREIDRKLTPLGINVDITLHGNKTVTLTATKHMGLSVQHASITGISLLNALWKLLKYIFDNLELWLEKELYPCD